MEAKYYWIRNIRIIFGNLIIKEKIHIFKGLDTETDVLIMQAALVYYIRSSFFILF